MDKLKTLLTDAKFVSALAIVIVAVASTFGIQWTEIGVESWIAEAVGIIAALAGGLYALKRGTDKTGEGDTTE